MVKGTSPSIAASGKALGFAYGNLRKPAHSSRCLYRPAVATTFRDRPEDVRSRAWLPFQLESQGMAGRQRPLPIVVRRVRRGQHRCDG